MVPDTERRSAVAFARRRIYIGRMDRRRHPSFFWGGVLVVAGTVFLLANLGLLNNIEWNLAWPVLLIGLGLFLLIARVGTGGKAAIDSAEPRDGLAAGRLEIAVGAGDVDVRAASLGDQLYTAHLDHLGSASEVRLNRATGTVRIWQQPEWWWFGAGRSRVDARLNESMPWALDCSTGAITGTFDLSAAQLSSFDMKTGASRIELNLPAPKGLVPIRVEGGALTVDLALPADAPIKVQASGAAVHLNTEGAHQDGLGSREWRSAGFDGSADRYEVQVTGGAATVNVNRR